ncbi:hypothetical protein [Sphingomonas sp.]|uniref:hypothetical protein n=1 Tax=Sphingomonas sp. TaxID=28214 RepID=UPI0025D1737E|nr:hypothetical protein [Sphingomonas sp.]
MGMIVVGCTLLGSLIGMLIALSGRRRIFVGFAIGLVTVLVIAQLGFQPVEFGDPFFAGSQVRLAAIASLPVLISAVFGFLLRKRFERVS